MSPTKTRLTQLAVALGLLALGFAGLHRVQTRVADAVRGHESHFDGSWVVVVTHGLLSERAGDRVEALHGQLQRMQRIVGGAVGNEGRRVETCGHPDLRVLGTTVVRNSVVLTRKSLGLHRRGLRQGNRAPHFGARAVPSCVVGAR